ncbi:WD40-repeat-containing domain protein, partial [Dimargaris cristalligena]
HWDQEFQYYYRLETNWYRGQYKTRDYRGHSSVVLAVRIDPVRRLVFSGGRDHVIKVWSLDSNRCVRTLRAHTNAVSCLDYDRMSATLVSGSWDGTVSVVVCDRATRSVISYIGNHCSPVTSLKLDQSYLVSGAEDSSILVWHHHQSTQLKGHNSDVNAIDMTESLIVSGSDDGLVKVWDF